MEELLVVSKCICLAFPSEEHYEQCMKDAGAFRQFLTTMYSQYPELFPRQMSQGFKFHSFTPFSRKQEGFRMRRIELSDGNVYQIRPSFMMPYLIARSDEMEKALYLCKWGVSFGALTYVFGHNDMFWYRA